jgi:PPP family 3-phenylpropionic acid transporter
MAVATIISSFVLNFLADSSGRPKLVLLCCSAGLIGMAALIRVSGIFSAIFVSAFFFYFLKAPLASISDKLILDSIHKTPELYSWFRLGGSLGYAIGSLAIGMIIAWHGILAVFPVFMAVMLICLTTILPMPIVTRKEGACQRPKQHDYVAVLRHKRFPFIYGTLALWGLAEAALSFYTLHLQKQGFDSRRIGLLLSITMFGEVVGFLLTVKLLKKKVPEKTIILSFICQLIRSSSLALMFPFPILILCQFIGGFSLPMIWASTTYLAHEAFPVRMGNVAQGFKVIAYYGLAQLIGAPFCGVLYQYISSSSVFWMVTSVCIFYITGYGLSQAFRR